MCDKYQRNTPLDEVWGVIKQMRGIRQEKNLPLLQKGGRIACQNAEKAEMLAKNFVKVHSSCKFNRRR